MKEKTASALGGRLRGFANRAPLSVAWAWLDAQHAATGLDVVPVTLAAGRILAEAITVPAGSPQPERAALDGYAVRAADCDGASAYNPLTLSCREWQAALPQGGACPIAAGWVLPEGADAVLPFEAAEPEGRNLLTVLAPVAASTGVDRHRRSMPPGATMLTAGRRLRPQDLAYLGTLGVAVVTVLQRPRVRLLVPGPKSGGDALTPLLLPLLARDGAQSEIVTLTRDSEHALAAALAGSTGAITLIAGRSGAGPDDVAAAAFATAGGCMAMHGLALQPGGSVGLGTLSGQPAILLPGDPFACFAAYELLAGRLIRLLAARPAMPYAVAHVTLGRKIVSGIGLTEVVPVTVVGTLANPVGSDLGMASLRADGFVLVAEASEGHAAGSTVAVHYYDPATTRLDFAKP